MPPYVSRSIALIEGVPGIDSDQYLRLTVRSFYVLEELRAVDIRCDYSHFRCTCPYHRIHSVCKHSVACTILQDRCTVPPSLDFPRDFRTSSAAGPQRKVKSTCQLRSFGDNIN